MFLTCTFASAPKTIADPFDSRLLRSVRFRGRTGAISTPGTRFPRRSPALPIHPRPPLPFRSSMEPSGSKRSTGSRFGKLTLPDVRLSLAPRRVLFRFRCGSTLQTRFALPGYRSVNPGTETMIDKRALRVKEKTNPIFTFNSFLCVVFSLNWRELAVTSLCINRGGFNMFRALRSWWNSASLVASPPDRPNPEC